MIEGVDVARSRVLVLARIGRRDKAIAGYIRFLTMPGTTSIHASRHGAFWAVLRDDSKWRPR